MPDEREKRIVNQALMSAGLGKLDDPGLIRQIGFIVSKTVTDHDSFRVLINRCAPEERRNMYEALKPYIRFELKPLDVYIAETMAEAEAKQLPVIGPDGNFKEFRIQDVKGEAITPVAPPTDLQTAQRVIDASLARRELTLLCRTCTKENTFHGMRREDCVKLARETGWREVHHQFAPDSEMCPACVEKYFPSSPNKSCHEN